MTVRVKLVDEHALYQKRLSSGEIAIADGSTVDDLIRELKLAYKYTRIIKVNGEKAELNTVLKNDDSVLIFPPVIGGG